MVWQEFVCVEPGLIGQMKDDFVEMHAGFSGHSTLKVKKYWNASTDRADSGIACWCGCLHFSEDHSNFMSQFGFLMQIGECNKELQTLHYCFIDARTSAQKADSYLLNFCAQRPWIATETCSDLHLCTKHSLNQYATTLQDTDSRPSKPGQSSSLL